MSGQSPQDFAGDGFNPLSPGERTLWLGENHIRIHMVSGAYPCREEGALISSGEGLRDKLRKRPPISLLRLFRQPDRRQ